MRIGIVVATHPEDGSVDIVMTDDYSRLAGVQVMTSGGNASSGASDLYAPEERTGSAKWDLSKVTPDNPIACVDFSGVMPIVVGFIRPQVGQSNFAEKNLRVNRHMSDVYSTLNSAGDFELAFPNGTFIRVGATPDHVNLAGQDVDGKWAIAKNTGAATHLRVVLGNGGAVKADLHISPDGNVTGTFQGTGNLTFVGDVVVNAPNVTVNTEVATINASESIELATPLVHCTDDLTVDGVLTYGGGLVGSGGGTTAAITGNVSIIGDIALTGNMTATGTVTDGNGDGGA